MSSENHEIQYALGEADLSRIRQEMADLQRISQYNSAWYYRLIIILSLLMGILLAVMALADAAEIPGRPGEASIHFESATPTNGALSFEIRVPAFRQESTPEGWAISFPGHPILGAPGEPQVGGLAFLIPGRRGFAARVEWRGGEFEERTNFVVAPVAAFRRIHQDDTVFRDEWVRSTQSWVYAGREWWPQRQLDVEGGIMGTQQWVRLVCRPNQYRPDRQELRAYQRIQGVLYWEGPAAASKK